MKKLVDVILEDISTTDSFRYQLSCGHCGSVYTSRPVRFSKAGIVPETEGKLKIYQTLYERENEQARTYAVTELARSMNYCPICKQIVCDKCFMICEDLDMCRGCAEHLKEEGAPVLSENADLP